MEAYNLKTASTYLNNLLLARGLLRDGKQIEFARPKNAEGGSEATMALVINLVHDLVLRRDREQEHREALALTLRNLRLESTESISMISKLQTANEDLKRQLALAQASERVAKTAQRTSEIAAKAQREEHARLKQNVQQIRTSCANDIRKRDVQIQRLKGHLADQQRGSRNQLNGATMVINPGFIVSSTNHTQGSGSKKGTNASSLGDSQDTRNDSAHSSLGTNDPGYSLRQETAEFLTQLGQSLSDENDALINIVRTTLAQLRELQGLSEQSTGAEHNLAVNTIPPNAPQSDQFAASHEELARDIQLQLANVHSILTSPNYVPLEEVTTRDEEIHRLRAGWDKMESRWREAVSLMHDWRKRMLDGETLGLDELRAGFIGDSSNVVVDDDLEAIDEEMDEEQELDEDRLEEMLAAGSSEEVDLPAEPSLMASVIHRQPRSGVKSTRSDSAPVAALQIGSGNRRVHRSPVPPSAKGKVESRSRRNDDTRAEDEENSISDLPPTPEVSDEPLRREGTRSGRRGYETRTETVTTTRRVRFSASVIANTPDADLSSSPPSSTSSALQARSSRVKTPRIATPYHRGTADQSSGPGSQPGSIARLLFTVDHDSEDSPEKQKVLPCKSQTRSRTRLSLHQSPTSSTSTPLTYLYVDPLQTLKRHSSPTRHKDEPSPKMSVQEKLNLAAAEAEAAAVAAGLQLDKIEVQVDMRTFEHEDGSPSAMVKHSERVEKASTRRRKSAVGMKGRPRRRKSTLTPEELEQLMFD